MNFTVYVNKAMGQAINRLTKEYGMTRNSIFRDALELWMQQHKKSEWPEGFFDFKPVKDVPDFKAHRKELKAAAKDPLA